MTTFSYDMHEFDKILKFRLRLLIGIAGNPSIQRNNTVWVIKMKAKIFSIPAIAGIILGAAAIAAPAQAEVQREAVERVAPDYPRGAERRGVEGHVVVSYAVEADGTVVEASVVESSPAGVFDRAALSAITSWAYAPAGTRTEGHTMTLEFSLSN